MAPAQDDAVAEDETAESEITQQQEEVEKLPEANVEIRSTPDTFVPSQEISEDLSVSFPVDI